MSDHFAASSNLMDSGLRLAFHDVRLFRPSDVLISTVPCISFPVTFPAKTMVEPAEKSSPPAVNWSLSPLRLISVRIASESPSLIMPLGYWKCCSSSSLKAVFRPPSLQEPSQVPETLAGTTQKKTMRVGSFTITTAESYGFQVAMAEC